MTRLIELNTVIPECNRPEIIIIDRKIVPTGGIARPDDTAPVKVMVITANTSQDDKVKSASNNYEDHIRVDVDFFANMAVTGYDVLCLKFATSNGMRRQQLAHTVPTAQGIGSRDGSSG